MIKAEQPHTVRWGCAWELCNNGGPANLFGPTSARFLCWPMRLLWIVAFSKPRKINVSTLQCSLREVSLVFISSSWQFPALLIPTMMQPLSTMVRSIFSINNNFFSRLWILLALENNCAVFKHDAPCYPISKHVIVKTGPFVHLTEAATMQFLLANTNIPVPRIYCSFVHKNKAYIAMERLRGGSLQERPGPRSPKPIAQGFQNSSRAILRELRIAGGPPGMMGVASCVGGSLTDSASHGLIPDLAHSIHPMLPSVASRRLPT